MTQGRYLDAIELAGIRDEHHEALMSLPNALATWVGYRVRRNRRRAETVVTVAVRRKLSRIPKRHTIPTELRVGRQTAAVDVVEIAGPRLESCCSSGHRIISDGNRGMVGMFVKASDGATYGLTAAHVCGPPGSAWGCIHANYDMDTCGRVAGRRRLDTHGRYLDAGLLSITGSPALSIELDGTDLEQGPSWTPGEITLAGLAHVKVHAISPLTGHRVASVVGLNARLVASDFDLDLYTGTSGIVLFHGHGVSRSGDSGKLWFTHAQGRYRALAIHWGGSPRVGRSMLSRFAFATSVSHALRALSVDTR